MSTAASASCEAQGRVDLVDPAAQALDQLRRRAGFDAPLDAPGQITDALFERGEGGAGFEAVEQRANLGQGTGEFRREGLGRRGERTEPRFELRHLSFDVGQRGRAFGRGCQEVAHLPGLFADPRDGVAGRKAGADPVHGPAHPAQLPVDIVDLRAHIGRMDGILKVAAKPGKGLRHLGREARGFAARTRAVAELPRGSCAGRGADARAGSVAQRRSSHQVAPHGIALWRRWGPGTIGPVEIGLASRDLGNRVADRGLGVEIGRFGPRGGPHRIGEGTLGRSRGIARAVRCGLRREPRELGRDGLHLGAMIVARVFSLRGLLGDPAVEPLAERLPGSACRLLRGLARVIADTSDAPRNRCVHRRTRRPKPVTEAPRGAEV